VEEQIPQFRALGGTKQTKVLHTKYGGEQTANELTKGGKLNISRFGRFIFLINIKVVFTKCLY
jgi:hypothetical protein